MRKKGRESPGSEKVMLDAGLEEQQCDGGVNRGAITGSDRSNTNRNRRALP